MSEEIRQKGIYVSILNQGNLRKENAALLTGLMQNDRYKIYVDFPSEKPISHNRNKIVQKFLSLKKYDYLLMIDDDVTPPGNIVDLADFQVDVISPIMFTMQKREVAPLAVKRTKDGKYSTMNLKGNEGLLEVDATGSGCMFIKREVLEHPDLKNPFQNHYDADGIKTTGLDFNFCTRAKKAGFRVYVHTDYVAGHFAEVDLKDIYEITVAARLINEELQELKKEKIKSPK
jgi:hypothetical protein